MRADRQKLVRLLKTARGQVDGVLRMMEEDQYCIDISRQILAAEAVLRRASTAPVSASTLRFGAIVLDDVARTVTVSGEPVELTCPLPEEFVRMLEKLRRNA